MSAKKIVLGTLGLLCVGFVAGCTNPFVARTPEVPTRNQSTTETTPGSMTTTPSSSPTITKTSDMVCNDDTRTRCVLSSARDTVYTNPMMFTGGTISSNSGYNLVWKITDNNNRIIKTGKFISGLSGINNQGNFFISHEYLFAPLPGGEAMLTVSSLGDVTTTPLALPIHFTTGTSTIEVLTPKDLGAYQRAVYDYATAGGKTNPGQSWPLVKRHLVIPFTTNTLEAAAEYAAEELPSQGDTHIIYFRVMDGRAYVVLNIDINGWAGVSMTISAVHPLIERTLLSYPGITKVIFDVAPGDRRDDLYNIFTNGGK